MHDLAFVGFLAALIAAGFRKPFLFILVYVYIDVVSPQRLSYFLLNAVPISLIAVVLAVAGWAVADDKRDVRLAPRQFLILLLLIYCWLTTLGADFPQEALDRSDERSGGKEGVSKCSTRWTPYTSKNKKTKKQ